jgi:hypothetical protein
LLLSMRRWKFVRGECRDKVYFGYAEPMPNFMRAKPE